MGGYLMYEIASLITKYLLVLVIYSFIFRIVRLIYMDIRAITVSENAVALVPHLKLLTPVVGQGGSAVAELYPLVRPVTTLGRSTKCTVVLPDAYVSSEHMRIEWQRDRFFIEDLGSANGTVVNGAKLEGRLEIFDGDRISAGGLELLFSEGGR